MKEEVDKRGSTIDIYKKYIALFNHSNNQLRNSTSIAKLVKYPT
ncbi:hypothetical protein [Pedobacter glucosidilyticus]